MRYIISILLGFICLSLGKAQIQVTADRPTANYEVGETMTFEITADAWGPIDYFIRYDSKLTALARGRIFVNPGQPTKIPFTLEDPGGVICVITNDSLVAATGAIFSAFDIQPYADEPADFDNYWNSVKAELATVPMDPILTPYSSTNLSETFRVNLGNINNRRVYGYISVPIGITPPYPAIITFPPFGDVEDIVVPDNIISEWGGALSMMVSIHNVEPDEFDPNSYLPNNNTYRDSIYYKHAVSGAIRAIDYIFSRDDFNGNDLGVVGLSQGGGLAIMAAGVDDRVKTLVNSVPALCGHVGHRFDKASGLPLYIRNSRGTNGTIANEDSTILATSYYDAVFFAKRFDGPTLTFISYADTISPSSTVFAAYNQFRDKNILMHSKNLGHNNPEEFIPMRLEFWRRFFPDMVNAPFQWSLTTTGYGVDLGPDITTSSSSTDLTATVDYNGDPLNNLKSKWMLVDGPGRVSFSTANSYNTTATFSEPGEYLIRFVAYDESSLSTEDELISFGDFIKVIVF